MNENNNDNNVVNVKREKEYVPSMENLKASLVFIVLTIAAAFIADVGAADILKKCNKSELTCKAMHLAADILPTLFGTIAVFLLLVFIVYDVLRLKGALRVIGNILIIISLPFVYIIIGNVLSSVNLFV